MRTENIDLGAVIRDKQVSKARRVAEAFAIASSFALLAWGLGNLQAPAEKPAPAVQKNSP